MVDRTIVKSVRNYLKTVQSEGIAVRFGIIFGSHAAGHTGPWSDIDVLVVSPLFDAPRNRRDVDLLWRVAARSDSRIEPIPCGERQWNEDSSSAIVEIARREGETIRIDETEQNP
ncbi:MAG: nucleotidyltransferase domain-containing protein [Pseudomonadota bacterium]|jgi:predicted nucleotidyltransferase|nr:nucleotidyltransferase domain-containing protein [Desulfobacterales bacterium]MBL7172728.1 nucleotidyltransferase domain-containing protein [Desulfobacteraceae bacterium]